MCVPPGVCACKSPWRGYDCSEPHREGSSSHHDGFVYVYSPPDGLGLAAMRRSHLDPLYSSEVVFTDRLMSDYSLRTLDPNRALLFYVPTWLLPTYPNMVYDKGVHHHRNLVAALEEKDAVFQAAWRTNRSRHLFFTPGDKGACLWPRGPIYLTHWGLTTPWKAQMLPHMWRTDELVSARANEPPCADERDVILPPVIEEKKIMKLTARRNNGTAAAADDSPLPASQWTCELFFAGAARAEQKAAKSSWCDDGARGGVKCYSQGVRAAVFEHHQNRSGFCLAPRLPSELYERSRFCLAPSGEGFGDRLATSLLAGCVPLIIQPAVRQPYDELLPYDRFALRVGADKVPKLHELLAAITPTEHAAMRAAARHYARAFDWVRPAGQAYAMARYSLCMRSLRPDGCEALRPNFLHQAASSPSRPMDLGDYNVGRVDATLARVPG